MGGSNIHLFEYAPFKMRHDVSERNNYTMKWEHGIDLYILSNVK